MFIHSRSSLENPTQFQTKMDKVYTRFQTKTKQRPYPMGRHMPICIPPGPQIHNVSLSTDLIKSCVWIIYPRYFRFQTGVCKTTAPSNM